MEEFIVEKEGKELGFEKKRNGCVTAWLILMLFANSLTVFSNFFFCEYISENLPSQPPLIIILLIGCLGGLNIVFTIMLFKWIKIGFFGFACSGIIIFIINLFIGIGFVESLTGLLGIIFLFGILKIKGNDGKTAWEGLE